MPECIVCKADYTPGEPCPRCRSDNTPWDNWRTARVEEQGGIDGLLAFTAPLLHLPLIITALTVPFGLMGIGGLWRGITAAAQLLAVAITVCLCLIATLAGYSARHSIREHELLNRVRRGYGALLNDTRLRALVAPAISLLLVLAIAYALVASDLLWKLAQWWFLDPAYLEQVERQETISDATAEGKQPEEADGLRKRVRQALPLILMGMYVALKPSLTYSASLLLAMAYAREMNKALPQPIFLQEDLLVGVVRRKAGRVVDRTTNPRVIGGEEERNNAEQEGRSWTWDEMERTADGGIRLKAIVKTENKTEENLIRCPTHITYVVEADPWSRITSIARVEEKET